MPDIKIIRAMFDIKPVDQSGGIDVEKIGRIESKVNLKRIGAEVAPVKASSIPAAGRETLSKELQKELKKKSNLKAVLAKVGGSFVAGQPSRWRRQVFTVPVPILPAVEAESQKDKVDTWWEKSRDRNSTERQLWHWDGRLNLALLAVIALLALAVFLSKDGFQEKVARDGNAAVQNLENAKADIEKFDFVSAAKNFNSAQHNFSAASDRLNLLGNAFGSFLGEIPGLGKLKSARHLTEAGENIAKAGESLSLAADNLSKTNFVSYLALSGNPEKPLTDFINSFRESLVFARKKFQTASILLDEMDPQIIPEEKRQTFLDFRAQLPMFEEFLNGSLDYSDLLLEMVGQSGPKKYLVLFQNNTELRATGGFVGSYALADFNRGFLRGFEVKDVYDTDGQAKTNIIPPKELQHITPVWGMRDANWFVNFPDSAKKIMQIYTENDGGPAVDGVISITPTVISKILAITGPVELPQYEKTIGRDNFLAEIQEEVEYGSNRAKPKQILIDFAPKFLEKLGQLDKEKWAEIFKILTEGAEEKHILAYFKNQKMEETAVKGGFGGEIKGAKKDYLSVVHTNVKGSKTDAYIKNTYELKSGTNETGLVQHDLTITRVHQGGKTAFGFYNRTNYDFVRVLVPEGSRLLGINGHAVPNFVSIVDYGDGQGFVTDSDLAAYERKTFRIQPGVSQSNESGKTVFGFWLVTEPGKTKTVSLKYETPVKTDDGGYSLLVQKQPGTIDDSFRFSLALPEGKQVIYRNPELTVSGDSVNFETKLLKDTEVELKFQ